MDKQSVEYKKLRWRTRRGMLELDLLLEPFFEQRFLELSSKQQHTFVTLLDQQDPDLLDWFKGAARPDDERHAEMVRLILENAKQSP